MSAPPSHTSPQFAPLVPLDLATRIRYCRRLPTVPAVALRILELAEDPNAALGQFAAPLGRDPALASRLLQVANSSFYGRRGAIHGLPEAVELLGLDATVALTLGFSLPRAPASDDAAGFDAAQYWRRAVVTALTAQALAAGAPAEPPATFLLAGLLQDIGVLVLATLYGDAYARVYAGCATHEDQRCAETLAFGCDHVTAGWYLLRHWGLPELLVNSVRASHVSGPAAEGTRLPAVVALAAAVADCWLCADGGGVLAQAAVTAGAERLGLDRTAFIRVIDTVRAQWGEAEALFETELPDARAAGLFEAAAANIAQTRALRAAADGRATQARLAGLEREVARLVEQTQRDPLTGLYNRVRLERVLEREFARVDQTGAALSVAFVDLDHFKAINDRFGHAAGDEVLTLAAQQLSSGARQTDTVVRYGGEEFVLILPGTDNAQAVTIVRRILAATSAAPFRTRSGVSAAVTFSAGVATQEPTTRAYANPAALVAAADQALYRVKRAGRAQVASAEDVTAAP